MRARIFGLLSALLTAGALAGAVAAPAQAQVAQAPAVGLEAITMAASGPVPPGKYCVGGFNIYQFKNYKGWGYCFVKSDPSLANNHYYPGKTVNNTASSVINDTPCYVGLYDGKNYKPARTHTNSYPHTADKDLSNDAIKDNRTSSLKFFGC